MWHDQTEKSDRSVLLSLASATGIKPVWVRVIPQTTSNNPQADYAERFHDIAIWAGADPRFGGLLLIDVSNSIEMAAGTEYATSEGVPFLIAVEPEGLIPPDWKRDKDIVAFCRARRYELP